MNYQTDIGSLTRFIFSERHYSVESNRVKHGAFLPLINHETSTLEVSVFQILGLSDEQIWSIGDTEVAQPSKRTLRARGDLTMATIDRNQLRIAADAPPSRHSNIIGWPEEKSKQKLIAIELANTASLHLR